MIAIIDIGSNTIRLSVYSIDTDGGIRQIHKLRNVVGLAGYVSEANILTAEGIAEACATLCSFRTALAGMNVTETRVFAAASLRNIANTDEVKAAIRRETGFDVDVISGEEEALCGYAGVANDIRMDDGLLIDIGGGSTELVVGKGGAVKSKASLPVGSLNMYTKHVAKILPTKAQGERIRTETITKLEASGINPNYETIPAMYGVGGVARALRKLNNAIADTTSDDPVGAADVKRILGLIELDARYMLDKITCVAPERVHTITPGLIILDAVMDAFGCETITVSESGVRDGYLLRNVIPPFQNERPRLCPSRRGSNA